MSAIISWQNAIERPGVDLSANSEVAGLGVQSLLTPTIAEVWRTDGTSSFARKIDVDFGVDVPIRVLAVAAPRDGILPGVGAEWRIRLRDVNGSEVLDSQRRPFNMKKGVAGYLASSVRIARSAEFLFYAAPGDPYLQLGRLWAGDALVTSGSISYGWQRGVLDTGSSERAALSGVRTIQRGAVARTMDFTLPRLTDAEAATMDDIALALGTSGQALVAPFETMAQAMLGRFKEPPSPAQPGFRQFTARISFEEDM
jgi:hypothetical protein